jgi:hypothetical protein
MFYNFKNILFNSLLLLRQDIYFRPYENFFSLR